MQNVYDDEMLKKLDEDRAKMLERFKAEKHAPWPCYEITQEEVDARESRGDFSHSNPVSSDGIVKEINQEIVKDLLESGFDIEAEIIKAMESHSTEEEDEEIINYLMSLTKDD